MAIVKGNYTRSNGAIKAHLKYIVHRPGKEGEKKTRALFGFAGELSKADAYNMMDAHKGMTYFRIVLNFHPKREDKQRDLDLSSITKQTMLVLEKRLNRRIEFIAVVHDNHGKNSLRHIHTIVPIKLQRGERLTRADFKALRDIATEKALFQRQALDLVQEYHQKRGYVKRSRAGLFSSQASRSGGRALRMRKVRQPTRLCPFGGKHAIVKMRNGVYWCPIHKKVHVQKRELAPALSQEESIELSIK